MFKDYKVTDGGKYVCQRKVLDKKPTFNFVNIVHERKLLTFSIFLIFKKFSKYLKCTILDIFERFVENILSVQDLLTIKIVFCNLADRSPSVQLPNLVSTFIELKNSQKNFQITCEVSGSPKPMKQWVKDGQVVQNCLDESSFCHLYLSEISYPTNDGIYSCVGTNAVGKANKSVTIQVNGKQNRFFCLAFQTF